MPRSTWLYVYCIHSATTYEVWLWMWPGFYKAIYPIAVPASLTNTPGISWHSQGVTLDTGEKAQSGTNYHKKRSQQPLQHESAGVYLSICYCWGDKMSRWRILCLVELHPFVLTFPCPPTESQNLDRDWTGRSQTRIRLNAGIFTDEENNPSRIPVAGTRKAAGRSAISSSFWGPEEASHSVQAQPTLWDIWVMCFTLGLLDLVPKKLPSKHNNIHSPPEDRFPARLYMRH